MRSFYMKNMELLILLYRRARWCVVGEKASFKYSRYSRTHEKRMFVKLVLSTVIQVCRVYNPSRNTRIDTSVYLRQRIVHDNDRARDEIIKSRSFEILDDVPPCVRLIRRHTHWHIARLDISVPLNTGLRTCVYLRARWQVGRRRASIDWCPASPPVSHTLTSISSLSRSYSNLAAPIALWRRSSPLLHLPLLSPSFSLSSSFHFFPFFIPCLVISLFLSSHIYISLFSSLFSFSRGFSTAVCLPIIFPLRSFVFLHVDQ